VQYRSHTPVPDQNPGGLMTSASTPAKSRTGLILALLSATYFMVILDAAIVRLAIPPIQRDLHLSAGAETWVANGYMLTFGSLLLLGGRLADVFGRKRMLLAGVGLFTVSSFAVGLAGSSAVIIGARAAQGLGAAMMTPTALSILMRTFPEGAERNKAMGVWSAMGGMGATAAWLIGGPLVDGPGWQWVFWINIPIGAALFAAAARLVPESRDLGAPRSFDIAGAGTVTASLAVLIYDLVDAPSHGWGSTRTIVLFAASVLLFAAFVVIERNAKHPLIPRRLAASRTVWAANIGLGGVMASIYGMVFILALYGENVLHWSASHLGFAGTVLPFSAAVGAGIGQTVVTKRGPRDVAIFAALGLIGGFVLLSGVGIQSDYLGRLLPAFALFGLALGAGATAFSIATLSGVHPNDAGLASGLNNTFESICGALGTAVLASIALTRTNDLVNAGTTPLHALDSGFQLGFGLAIAFPVLSLVAALALGRVGRPALGKVPTPEPALD
jgi:EmrB/QacA subfamily drug resistance transporter